MKPIDGKNPTSPRRRLSQAFRRSSLPRRERGTLKCEPGRPSQQPGFALPAVLIVVGALLILAIGILLITGIERDTARSFVDRERADLAARAGLEELRGILAQEAANDDYLVIQSSLVKANPPVKELAPHLFIARADPDTAPGPTDKKYTYRYIPLFSALDRPADALLKTPELEPLTGDTDEHVNFSTLPYLDQVRAAWIPIKDEKDRIVARYAFWVEDLQSRVDPAIAGNTKGKDETHARVQWPFPAPGLNNGPEAEPALDQIATFALDPDATVTAQGDLGKTLIKNRKLLLSPDSLLAAAKIQPPLERMATGELADETARAVEKGLAAGIQSYQEQPLVPFADGIDPAAAGDPKLNLNKLLATGGDAAVTEMAEFISEALPDFEQRKGGFPDDYLKTLAANALDYADADNEPTLKTGGYRGIDGYPLVSEYLFKISWERKRTAGGRNFIDLSVSVYVEFWNMTNVPVDGKAEITYETKYAINPDTPNPLRLDDLTNATHNLSDGDGYKWFPAINVDLKPDEYRIFRCGTVSYSFDMGPEGQAVPNTLPLKGELSASPRPGYRMRWNGKLVDQSRGGVRRPDMTLSFKSVPGDEETNVHDNRQQIRASIPGHTGWSGGAPASNMGDARMACHIMAPQNHYAYPEGYSPNRRNIRLNLYTNAQNRVIGRVLPSEWPDGGHDPSFGIDGFHGLFGMTMDEFNDAAYLDPLDPRFLNQPPDLTHGSEEAPTRLSNSGRFYSVTELGRIYDPMMWQTLPDPNPYAGPSIEPGQTWGDVVSGSASSENHGGGNTLRIGRSEHPKFNVAGLRASHLLDLFHTGISRSEDPARREGAVVKIHGHVNLNTASRSALRQMLAGSLGQDPEIKRFVDDSHAGGANKFPLVQKLDPVPDATAIADRVAGAIIASRPYASTGELAKVREFGNGSLFPGFTNSGFPKLQWTDSAKEELFARAHEASTVRSRNFRIWVVGQSLAPSASANAPVVLAEVRKAFTVFADPGERQADGTADPAKFKLNILHENDF